MLSGIRNLIDWLPVIWRDRDWDWIFLIRILRLKLSRMERFFEKDAMIADRDKVARRIREARMLTDRLIADEYWRHKDWQHEEFMVQQDVDRLCEIMRKYMRGWWD